MRSMVKGVGFAAAIAAVGVMVGEAAAQDRPLSTRGHAATQLGGAYNDEGRYEGGYWIDVHYGRPILRARNGIFGEGAEYGQRIYAGAPVWRLGADQTTTFTTEADLLIGGQRLNAGEYTLFADLSDPAAWTLIFTTWRGKQDFREDDPNANQWGDVPATYHNRATGFSFVDGHAEVHKWQSDSTVYPVNFSNLGQIRKRPFDAAGRQDIKWYEERIQLIPFR